MRTNSTSEYRLLVEGTADKVFFEAVLKNNIFLKQGSTPKIDVYTPNDLSAEQGGQKHGGKGNAISSLNGLIKSLDDALILKIALVLDTDRIDDGGGIQNTLKLIGKKLKEVNKEHGTDYVYYETTNKQMNQGFVFKDQSDKKLPDINLWLMPNNLDEGYLENFIIKNIVDTDKKLFEYAEKCVDNLTPPRKFKDLHLQKSQLATYLAFQEKPDCSFSGLVHLNLINFEQGTAKDLMDWLINTFPKLT